VLIETSRHTREDLQYWRNVLQPMDDLLSQGRALLLKAERSIRDIRKFWRGAGYAGVSWGKDSVAMLDLVCRAGLDIPAVWVRVEPITNPDCLLVRDAFLERWPSLEYHEIEMRWTPARAEAWAAMTSNRSLGYTPKNPAGRQGFRIAAERFGDRHISGVRGQESRTRNMRMRRWGVETERTLAPIGWWSVQDVFAYLHLRDLPVHPAYGMTRGGLIKREAIRVDLIGGGRGAGMGYSRVDWEGLYYPDVVDRAQREAREELGAAP